MHTLSYAAPRLFVGRRVKAALVFLLGFAISLFLAGPASAVPLDALTTIGGPLATALTQLAGLETGIKALIGFIAFIVAFITLAALKNMSSVLFYVGLLIFGAVALPIGAAILGAVI